MNEKRVEVIDELYSPRLAGPARRWITPFLRSFPDTRMEIVELVVDGDRVAARFRCSGTHLGEWDGHPPTGRRFERIDEVAFYRIHDGRITKVWSLEDTTERMRQLGLIST